MLDFPPVAVFNELSTDGIPRFGAHRYATGRRLPPPLDFRRDSGGFYAVIE
jgi:hypothetical protein